jgi:hypothetical protein
VLLVWAARDDVVVWEPLLLVGVEVVDEVDDADIDEVVDADNSDKDNEEARAMDDAAAAVLLEAEETIDDIIGASARHI